MRSDITSSSTRTSRPIGAPGWYADVEEGARGADTVQQVRRFLIIIMCAAGLLVCAATSVATPGAGVAQFGDRGSVRFNETKSRASEQVTAQRVIGLADGSVALPTIVETTSADGTQASAAFRVDRADGNGALAVGTPFDLGAVVNASVVDATEQWVWVVGTESATTWRVWRFAIDGTPDVSWGTGGAMALDVPAAAPSSGYDPQAVRDETAASPDGGLYLRSGKRVFAISGGGAPRTDFGEGGHLTLTDRSYDGHPSEVAIAVDAAGRLITGQSYMKGRDGVCVVLTGAKRAGCPKPTPGAHILRARRFAVSGQPDASFGGAAGARFVVRRFPRKMLLRPASALGLTALPGGGVIAQFDQMTIAQGIQNQSRIVQLTSSGTPDTAFSGDGLVVQHLQQPVVLGTTAAPDPLVDDQGRILLVRPSQRHSGAEIDMHLTRVSRDGSLDASWDRAGTSWLDSDRTRADEESVLDAALAPNASLLVLAEATYRQGPTGWWQTISKLDASDMPGAEQRVRFSVASTTRPKRTCTSGRPGRCLLPEGGVVVSGTVTGAGAPRVGASVELRAWRRSDEGYWESMHVTWRQADANGRFEITMKPRRIPFGAWRLTATAASDIDYRTSDDTTVTIDVGPRWALDAQDGGARARALIELAVENIDLNTDWSEETGVTAMCQVARACARGSKLLRLRLVDGRRAGPGKIAFDPGRPLGVYRLLSRIAPAGHDLDFIVTYDQWGDARSTCHGDRQARRLLCPQRSWYM